MKTLRKLDGMFAVPIESEPVGSVGWGGMKADSLAGLDGPTVEEDATEQRPPQTYVSGEQIHCHGGVFAGMIGVALALVVWMFSCVTRDPGGAEGGLLVLVIACGFAGGLIHSATSLAVFAGNRQLLQSWMLWFYLRGPVGALLAVLVYLGYRAGVYSDTVVVTKQTVFMIGFLSGLAGLFSKQVTDKLSDLIDVLFASPQAKRRADALDSAEAKPGGGTTAGPPQEAPDDTIRRVQEHLRTLGYLAPRSASADGKGASDGVLDQATRDALQLFLNERVGPDTQAVVGEEEDPDYWPRVEQLLAQAITA